MLWPSTYLTIFQSMTTCYNLKKTTRVGELGSSTELLSSSSPITWNPFKPLITWVSNTKLVSHINNVMCHGQVENSTHVSRTNGQCRQWSWLLRCVSFTTIKWPKAFYRNHRCSFCCHRRGNRLWETVTLPWRCPQMWQSQDLTWTKHVHRQPAWSTARPVYSS